MYWKTPAVVNVWLKDSPWDRKGLSQPLPLNMPSWPDVLVWGTPSSLSHITVSPTLTVRLASV